MAVIKYFSNRVVNQNGIVDGAKVFIYQTETTTLVPLFLDVSFTSPTTNPYVVAAGAAVPPLYTSYPYPVRLRVETPEGAVVYEEDPYNLNSVETSFVLPQDFGAAGDGVSDDTAYLIEAMASGKTVDGAGKAYAFTGPLYIPEGFVKLRNASLVWLNPVTATGAAIDGRGRSNYTLEDVELYIGNVQNTGGSGDSDRNGFRLGSLSPDTLLVEGIRLINVRVRGDGSGSRIQIRGANSPYVENCFAGDGVVSFSPDPTNDIANGYDFKYCKNLLLVNSVAKNLKCVQGGTPIPRRTRGFLFAETENAYIADNIADTVDQGFDWSGAITPTDPLGNINFSHIGGKAIDCFTYGVKFANVARNGLCQGVTVIRPGFIGVVVSPSAVTLSDPTLNTSNIDIVGCKVMDPTGSGGVWPNPQGFRLMSNGVYLDYPRNIRFKACTATDTQAVPKMVDGFASDVVYSGEGPLNQVVACTSVGHTSQAQEGFNKFRVLVSGTGTQAIPENVLTNIEWTEDILDGIGMHSTTTNPDEIIIKASGRYSIGFLVVMSPNGDSTKYRKVQLSVNGSSIPRGMATASAVTGEVTTLEIKTERDLAAGDIVTLGVIHNATSSVSVALGQSYLSLELAEEE